MRGIILLCEPVFSQLFLPDRELCVRGSIHKLYKQCEERVKRHSDYILKMHHPLGRDDFGDCQCEHVCVAFV